ncbi:hypothetical protein ACWY4P_41095 [Streptomyces sp. LZ34]
MTKDHEYDERNFEYALRGDIYGGDPSHAHLWTWTDDDGNGHMGYVCDCGAYRP